MVRGRVQPMSYCGACGGYAAGCPFPGQGRCVPAANPHEERAVNLFALAVAMNAEVAGMVTANQNMMLRNLPPPFGKQQFDEVAAKIRKEIGKNG